MTIIILKSLSMSKWNVESIALLSTALVGILALVHLGLEELNVEPAALGTRDSAKAWNSHGELTDGTHMYLHIPRIVPQGPFLIPWPTAPW